MRTPSILALAAAVILAGCSSPPPGFAPDPCPPAEPVTLPGYQEPIYKTICEPIYEERKTPVWGHKTVPAFQERRTPVTITMIEPITGCEQLVELWDRTQKVQVGVRRVPACLGFRTERVQVGSRPKRILVGWRTVDGTTCR